MKDEEVVWLLGAASAIAGIYASKDEDDGLSMNDIIESSSMAGEELVKKFRQRRKRKKK